MDFSIRYNMFNSFYVILTKDARLFYAVMLFTLAKLDCIISLHNHVAILIEPCATAGVLFQFTKP